MNNRSTEHLINSDGSIEELFVPSTGPRHPATGAKSDNHHLGDDKLVATAAALTSKLPIPATRRSLLPAITSDDSKDSKNDRNQKTQNLWKLSGDIGSPNESRATLIVVNERKASCDNVQSFDANSESDNGLQQPDARDVSLPEMSPVPAKAAIAAQRKAKQVARDEENSPERLPIASLEQAENVQERRSSAEIGSTVVEPLEPLKPLAKHKRKPKRKVNKKSAKASAHSKDSAAQVASNVDLPLEERQFNGAGNDSFKIMGVRLHETSALRFDRLIRHPRIRVSIYDRNTGHLLEKSIPARNAVLNYEPTHMTFIQPILSNPCSFKESSQIECYWSDETLIINEDIRYIQRANVFIFFEIIDFLVDLESIDQYAKSGWYRICWAFLRPDDGRNCSYIGEKCQLQLYHFQRNRHKHNIWDDWRAQKRIKYPAYLTVTVGPHETDRKQSAVFSRPMSVMEEEKTGDIDAYTANDDFQNANEQPVRDANVLTEQNVQQHLNSDNNGMETITLNVAARLPGEECKCPNRVAYKHCIRNALRSNGSTKASATNTTQYGSMASAFSPSGELIAFHCTTYMRSNHEIVIMRAKSMHITHTLIGHISIVYDIDWLDDRTLASVSSDRTAIVWQLDENNKFTLKIMPHPSFVYAVQWLNRSSKYAFVVSGGRDCVLRIWKHYFDGEHDIELGDELIQHDNYVTSMVTSRKGTTFFTADWNGVLLQWMRNKKSRNGPPYQLHRKIKAFASGVLGIRLHPKFNRLYVQCVNDPTIYVIETMTGLVIQTIQLASDAQPLPLAAHERKTFTISPCGFLIFCTASHHDTIECFKLSNGEKVAQYIIPLPLIVRACKVTSMIHHPSMNLMAFTIFGDSIDSSLHVAYHDNGETVEPNYALRTFGSLALKGQAERSFFDALSTTPAASNAYVSNALLSILEQIDDLFMVATPSPRRNYDFERLKDMQLTLQRLQLTADRGRLAENRAQMPEQAARTEPKWADSDLSARSDATHTITPPGRGGAAQSTHGQVLDAAATVQQDNGSDDSSNHTYVLQTNAPLQVQAATEQQSDANENNTYSISSTSSGNVDLRSKMRH